MVSNKPILKPPGVLRVNDVFRLQTQVVRWIEKDVGGQQDSKDRISRWRFKSFQRNTIEQTLCIYIYIPLKTKGCSFERFPTMTHKKSLSWDKTGTVYSHPWVQGGFPFSFANSIYNQLKRIANISWCNLTTYKLQYTNTSWIPTISLYTYTNYKLSPQITK